jgi:carbonic anhydrase
VTSSEELIRQARSSSAVMSSKTPRRNTAVIACIDSRVDPPTILGGTTADYHVIRNAGGLVTTDALRSVVVSQYYGTNQVIVLMHTDCGAMGYPAEAERMRLEGETGQPLEVELYSFDDLETELGRGVDRLRQSPLLRYRDRVKGMIYDVETGQVRTVMA